MRRSREETSLRTRGRRRYLRGIIGRSLLQFFISSLIYWCGDRRNGLGNMRSSMSDTSERLCSCLSGWTAARHRSYSSPKPSWVRSCGRLPRCPSGKLPLSSTSFLLVESLESVACFPTTSPGTHLSILDVGSSVTKVMSSNQISPYQTPHNIVDVVR